MNPTTWEGRLRLARSGRNPLPGIALFLAALAAVFSASTPVRAGTVVCAGSGPLGDGTTSDSNVPVRVRSLSNVISLGMLPSLAVKSDGTVWVWGNEAGDPAQVSGLDNVVAVRGSELPSTAKLALKADGTVWQWSETSPVLAPVADPADPSGYLTGVTAIASGERSHYALKADGSVWAWGRNYLNDFVYGLLGDGTTIDRATPVRCLNLANIKAIAADRSHAMALGGDGTVWAWGSNWQGQLGDGTTATRLEPIPVFPGASVASPGTGAVAIAASAYSSYLLRADGTVWSCGANDNGQLGDGTRDGRKTWGRVPDLTGVVSIASGPNAWVAVAVKSDGSAWGWGLNDHGHLGCGTNVEELLPCRVRGAFSEGTEYLGGIVAVATDVDRTCFLTSQEPVRVPSIAMATTIVRNLTTVAATVTVLDRSDNPVPGALVSGRWSTATTSFAAAATGSTGPDGTVTLVSPEFHKSNRTCTLTVDSVTKPDAFLDRTASMLASSVVVTH